MRSTRKSRSPLRGKVCRQLFGAAAASLIAASAWAWEPSKPVEFIVPAGTGGGADQMARFVQGMVAKHSLMRRW